MYKTTNVVGDLERLAEKFIMDNDRMLYRAFFEAAETFCAKNSVLIGGRVGVDLAVGRPLDRDSFFWDLYCDDTFIVVKNLVIELSNVRSPHIPAKTAALQTNIRYKEFTIYINARMLFRVFSMEKYRGLKLIDVMGHSVYTGYFTGASIKCVPEEIQLISIYRNLYTPARLAQWKAEMENEGKIYGRLRQSIHEKATRVTGGGGHDDITACLLKVVQDNSYVLVGDYALAALGLTQSTVRVQFIASDAIEEVRKRCERCVKRGKVTHVRFSLNIPDDFQIVKHSLYMMVNGKQTAIADVFNSTAFEMMPFIHERRLRLGNPWVLLRFLFIDIWVLKLILNLGSAADSVRNKIAANIKHVDALRTKYLSPPKYDQLFQLTDYAGQYMDDYVAKKKLIKETGERLPIFYPAKSSTYPLGGASWGADDEPTVDSKHATSISSQSVDITVDVPTKKQILLKIVGEVINGDIMGTLVAHAKTARQYSKWGMNKSIKGFFLKNSVFLKYVPEVINHYVDIGCGDGLDITALRSRYRVSAASCVDVEDFRAQEYKSKSVFVQVELSVPLALEDNTADLVAVFHSLHHMRDDALWRLVDVVRITRPGGIIFIKDHDVRTTTQASNVDFEHLVYMLTEGHKGASDDAHEAVTDLMSNFHAREPMTYYSRDTVHETLNSAGCKLIWTGEISKRTYVYGSVFQKNH